MHGRPLATLLGCVLLVACGGDAPVPRRPATPLDPATTGTIRGQVRLEGTPPPMTELPVGNWAGCQGAGGPVLTGDMLVKDGLVQNAFVWVKDGLGDRVFAIPETPVQVDQKGCVYVPRVLGAMVGQPIEFVNSDAILHNVHGVPKGSSSWNVSLAVKGAKRSITLTKPEVMVSVRCDLHPWMQAYIGALDHPYFAVTGPDGRFTLPNVPGGDLTVAVWHERFGTRETKLPLAAKETKDLSFTLAVP